MAKCKPGSVSLLFEPVTPWHHLYSRCHLPHAVCERCCSGTLGFREMGPLLTWSRVWWPWGRVLVSGILFVSAIPVFSFPSSRTGVGAHLGPSPLHLLCPIGRHCVLSLQGQKSRLNTRAQTQGLSVTQPLSSLLHLSKQETMRSKEEVLVRFANSVLPEVTVPLSLELDRPIVCLVAAARQQSSAEEALHC